jgi:glycosyltransferase EpsE
MTLVSVIMGVYNQGDEVGRAIASIQQQTYPHWDLVIVDDGSSDHTGEVLHGLSEQDVRLKVLRNPRNLGLAASLNRALSSAAGQLIARMDSDDVSFPERLSRQVAFLADHPEVDVLGAGAIEVDCKGRVLGAIKQRELHVDLAANIYRENPFIHPTVMARARFFAELGGYNEKSRRAEDYDLWLRGYRCFRYHNLQTPLIYYRRNRGLHFRDAADAAVALWSAAARESKWISRGCYGLRPLLAYGAWRLGCRQ